MSDDLRQHVDIVGKAHEWGDDRKIAEVYEIVDKLDYVQAQTVLQLFAEFKNNNPAAWRKWNAQHYVEEPVPFNEWIKNPDFTGKVGQDFWPVWQEEISTVCEPRNGIVEWYVTGCIGGGKTYSTLVAQLYKGPYICSCLKNPQKYFGIADGSEIVFGLFNAILTNAVEVDFNQMARFVKESPWFRDHCPAVCKRGLIHWPTREMTMRIGSSEMHALGANLFSYLIDEVNFMKTPMSKEAHDHQAYKIYHHASRRLKSRFQKHGICPGLACIVSSRLATSSFLEVLMEDNKGDPQTYVSDFAMWESKGRENFSPGEFRVACGSKYRKSEVLDEVDTRGRTNTFEWVTLPGGKPCPEGMKCVRVPNDFWFDFNRDMDGSLRDIAGIATHGLSSLIYRTEAVLECVDHKREHPFMKESHELSLFDDNAALVNFVQWRKLAKIVDGAWIPYVFPDQPRFCHIDLGLTGDCCGIAVGCAYSQFIQHSRDIETGQPTETFMPKVYVDFMLRIKPTKGEQIDLQKVIDFVLNLRNYGYWVQRVTFDGFASEMPIQSILKANLLPPRHMQQKKSADEVVKLESYVVSVDKDDKPYRLLRDMIQSNAINYYHYQPFIDEVLDLEHDVTQTAGGNIKGKVDHPDGGSKDTSDAVCGMVWGIATAKTPHGSEPTEGMIGDYKATDEKAPVDEQLNEDIISDYADPSRIKAIMNPTPSAPPPQKPAGRKKILTRANWQTALKDDGFGIHRP